MSAGNFPPFPPSTFLTSRWPQPFLLGLPHSQKSDWDNRDTGWSSQPQSAVFSFGAARWIPLFSTLNSFIRSMMLLNDLLVCSSSFIFAVNTKQWISLTTSLHNLAWCSLFCHQVSAVASCMFTAVGPLLSTNTSIANPPLPLSFKGIQMHLQQHSSSYRGDDQWWMKSTSG